MNQEKSKYCLASSPLIDGCAPHLVCKPEDITDIVLLPGDPGRVEMFKELCPDFKIISSNREFTIGKGSYEGVSFNVCSTGIGAGSAEIAVIELIQLGAKALIRIGGTGVLKKEIELGDMVINTGAIRKGGSSQFYVPAEYPAIASYEVVDSLIKACEMNKAHYWKGISASVGSFFAGQGRPILGKEFYDPSMIEDYQKMNVINMEMEAETIMTLGSLFNIYTGSICAVHANRITDQWLVDFKPAQLKMLKIALDACVVLKKNYLNK